MQLKDGVEIPSMEDFYYDLFDGGYIKPEELLDDPEAAENVRRAIRVIQRFEQLLLDASEEDEDD